MKSRLPLVVGTILLLFLGIVLIWIVRFPETVSNPRKTLKMLFGVPYPVCAKFPSDSFEATVTGWKPDQAELAVDLDSGCRASLFAQIPQVAVIVPV